MDSPAKPQRVDTHTPPSDNEQHLEEASSDEHTPPANKTLFDIKQNPSQPQTPEPTSRNSEIRDAVPGTPEQLSKFDWEHFQGDFEQALLAANEAETAILKEADALSTYFQAWASAASAHDDERAAKRLQTRQRFVNLSEEKLAQKQRHYEEVVRAFQSALALLGSH